VFKSLQRLLQGRMREAMVPLHEGWRALQMKFEKKLWHVGGMVLRAATLAINVLALLSCWVGAVVPFIGT
jgi:hypothetical protein